MVKLNITLVFETCVLGLSPSIGASYVSWGIGPAAKMSACLAEEKGSIPLYLATFYRPLVEVIKRSTFLLQKPLEPLLINS